MRLSGHPARGMLDTALQGMETVQTIDMMTQFRALQMNDARLQNAPAARCSAQSRRTHCYIRTLSAASHNINEWSE